ncbi:hypothetical protein [Zooshikella ganghwensis]|uniref:hypothetical protein n=1 Tax=Zooshikella ganghwensis TaxID=202772 RepID=UPI0012FB7D5C|nr:hypothetical protein [Zooshikella ganghwensis]
MTKEEKESLTLQDILNIHTQEIEESATYINKQVEEAMEGSSNYRSALLSRAMLEIATTQCLINQRLLNEIHNLKSL